MYTTFASLREIHLEITNRCNAACPMCARNVFGGRTIFDERFTELSLELIHKIFDPRFEQLQSVLFCGTHGDPLMSNTTLPAIQYLCESTAATVEFYTNGSLRDDAYWAELGRILHRQNRLNSAKMDMVVFGIDGLEDTHALYRRGTDFKKILHNVDVFVRNGGTARWDYLVFKHNEHQVEAAQALARRLGVKYFRLRKTNRFTGSPLGPERFPVLSRAFTGTAAATATALKDGRLTPDYFLEPPTESQLRHDAIVSSHQPSAISCLYKKEFSRLFVDSEARVFPCSFLNDEKYKSKSDFQEKVIGRYGGDFNSLQKHTWDEVLHHPWYRTELEASWNEDFRLKRCAKTCGKVSSPILSQSESVSLYG